MVHTTYTCAALYGQQHLKFQKNKQQLLYLSRNFPQNSAEKERDRLWRRRSISASVENSTMSTFYPTSTKMTRLRLHGVSASTHFASLLLLRCPLAATTDVLACLVISGLRVSFFLVILVLNLRSCAFVCMCIIVTR